MTLDAAQTTGLVARLPWQIPLCLGLLVLSVVVVGVRPELVGFLYIAVVTPELARIDIAAHRLPNAIVIPAFGFAFVGLIFGGIGTAEFPTVPLTASAATFVFLTIMNVAGGLGMGDVKLGAALALCLGHLGVLAAIVGPLLGFICGGIVVLSTLVMPGTSIPQRIAFGPLLLLGFWVAVAGWGLSIVL